jgi:N-acyl-phosphatidylethanolamine-hydrolysing phospholipase D
MALYDGRRFRNLNPAFRQAPAWRRLAFVASRLWHTSLHTPSTPLTVTPNDGRELRSNRTAPTVTWIGHATLLVQLGGVSILTDPHWSTRASPVAFAGPKRLIPPGLPFDQLPPIQVVLLSHDHYDHLDLATVRRLARAHAPRFVVPLGIGGWLRDRGIHGVVEHDWWGMEQIGDVALTCVPAQHFSGRTLWDHDRRLWCGWAIQSPDRRLFFAGDTGYDPALFADISDRLGPIDVAAVPIGAYLPPIIMRHVHSTPEQAIQIFTDLGAGRLLAMHWGTFDLAEEPIGEPPIRLAREAHRVGLSHDRLWIMSPGETRRW